MKEKIVYLQRKDTPEMVVAINFSKGITMQVSCFRFSSEVKVGEIFNIDEKPILEVCEKEVESFKSYQYEECTEDHFCNIHKKALNVVRHNIKNSVVGLVAL